MANDPQLTLSVLADIKGLQTGMQQAERAVSDTSTKMKKAVDSVDMAGRFQKQAQGMIVGIKAVTFALEGMNSAGGDLTTTMDSLSQSLIMSGSKSLAIVGGVYQLGSAASELFLQTQKKAREELERLSALQKEELARSQTRDLERQLEILKETDAIKKLELEGARELANINERARREDKTEADRVRTQAEQTLAIERTRQRIEEARKQTAKDGIEGVVDTLTTSIGGSFRVAQRGAMSTMQQKATQAAEKTAENTKAMLDLMRRGEGGFS